MSDWINGSGEETDRVSVRMMVQFRPEVHPSSADREDGIVSYLFTHRAAAELSLVCAVAVGYVTCGAAGIPVHATHPRCSIYNKHVVQKGLNCTPFPPHHRSHNVFAGRTQLAGAHYRTASCAWVATTVRREANEWRARFANGRRTSEGVLLGSDAI